MVYHHLLHITTFVIIIHFMECKETGVSAHPAIYRRSKMQLADSGQCPLWFLYNSTTRQCECYNLYPKVVKCMKQRAFLRYNHYMTHSKEIGLSLFLGRSFYYDVSGLNRSASQPGFIELPSNVSELNDYMCGSANRKGFLCNECIDGFGPSATSPKFKCMNCSNTFARYSVTIYLLSELVPVTIFYFIILFFQINLTSAPMVNFIFYSQIVHNAISYSGIDTLDQMKYSLSIASVFHGIWNLNFFRYVTPPFCISPKLQIIHIVYLQSISTIFPFFLIVITWIVIELYSRNCMILRAVNKLLKYFIKAMHSPNITAIDTFATFFLLSYTRLIFVLSTPSVSVSINNINDTTLAVSCIHRLLLDTMEKFLDDHESHYIVTVAISALIFLTFILPPVILLALYPVSAFRSLLFKCCSSRCMASLTIFVEKFYNCYRDGLDGGRDMRSWAALPFFVILLGFALNAANSSDTFYIFSACCMFWSLATAIVQPYKEKFMAITDIFIFANTSILSTTFCIILKYDDTSHLLQNALKVFGTLPMIWLAGFITFKLLKTKTKALLDTVRKKLPCCRSYSQQTEEDNQVLNRQIQDFNDLPDADCMLHPEQYIECRYGSIS